MRDALLHLLYMHCKAEMWEHRGKLPKLSIRMCSEIFFISRIQNPLYQKLVESKITQQEAAAEGEGEQGLWVGSEGLWQDWGFRVRGNSMGRGRATQHHRVVGETTTAGPASW